MTSGTDRIVHVPLGDRSYDVAIGTGLLPEAGERLAPFFRRPRTVIVSDETVAALHLETLQQGLNAGGIASETVIVPPGETSKSWPMLERVVEALLAAQVERDDLVIALGGGVIGDLAGFACAILRRGVGFIQVPTSLLAQVDSSVGGKTGINSPLGKNLIGAFHQPRHVMVDIDVLDTLDGREFLSGYGEVVKYGLLGDAPFFDWLEKAGPRLRDGNKAARIEAVERSVAAKAGIVSRDEKENGERALLNLGHTFAHALEAATGYSQRLLHGEAVAIGTGLAFALSARLGLCSQETPSRVAEHFAGMGLKRTLADIEGPMPDAAGLIALMAQDKKVRDGVPAFILARGIGEAFVSRDVPADAVEAVLAEALAGRAAD